MKVLLIWEEIPERTTLYSLSGSAAELAIKAAGQYVNAGENNDAAEELSEYIHNHEPCPLGNGESNEAFDITNHDKVVISGFVM